MKKFVINVLITMAILAVLQIILLAIFGKFPFWIMGISYIVGGAVENIRMLNKYGDIE